MNFSIAAAMGMPASMAAGAAPGVGVAAGVGTISDGPQHRKLTEAAQQFEGMLLQEMLKPMKEHGFGGGDGDDGDKDKNEGGGFGDTLSSYGTESLATAIAKSGGLGIAKRVVAQVEGEKAAHDGGAQRAKVGGSPGIASPGIPK